MPQSRGMICLIACRETYPDDRCSCLIFDRRLCERSMNGERIVEKRGLSKEVTKSDDLQRIIYNVGVRNEVTRRLRKRIKEGTKGLRCKRD